MSEFASPRRFVYLAVVVVVAGLLLLLQGGDPGPVDEDPFGIDSALPQSPVDTAPALSGIQGDEPEARSRTASPRPALRVVVEDEEGSPLPDARIVAISPDERRVPRESTGSGSWDNLELGLWTVEVRAEMCVPATRSIDLQLGDTEELRFALRRGCLLEGTVKTEFGGPINGAWIYLLREGEEHPRFLRDEQGLIKIRASRDGEFRSEVIPPGEYKVSVGPPSRALIASPDMAWFDRGEIYRLDAVIPGNSFLQVMVKGGSERAKLAILRFDESLHRRFLEGAQRDPENAEKYKRKLKEKDFWREVVDAKMRDAVNGVATFPRQRPGEYKLEIKDLGGSYRTEATFEVVAKHSLLVIATLPSGAAERRDGNVAEAEEEARKAADLPKWKELPFRAITDPDGGPGYTAPGLYWR